MDFIDAWQPNASDDEEEEEKVDDAAVQLARRLGGGRAAARAFYAGGTTITDFVPTVQRMLDSALPVSERLACVRAIGDLAQVVSNAGPLRDAGAVSGCVQLLSDPDAGLCNSAAEAIRHLSCASNPNRVAAREHGAAREHDSSTTASLQFSMA